MLLGIGDIIDPDSPLQEPGRIGGTPWLPTNFEPPRSVTTGRQMAFLFQIVFPEGHDLRGYTLAMFLALDEVDEDFVIPPLSSGELARIPVTKARIAEQQALHGVFLFERDTLHERPDLLSPVEARELLVSGNTTVDISFGNIGTIPLWLMGDETPNDLDCMHQGVFCLSIMENLVLPRVPEGPPQIVLDVFAANGRRANTGGYQVFAGNAVFFFAYPGAERRVVVVVQGT